MFTPVNGHNLVVAIVILSSVGIIVSPPNTSCPLVSLTCQSCFSLVLYWLVLLENRPLSSSPAETVFSPQLEPPFIFLGGKFYNWVSPLQRAALTGALADG